MTVAAFAAVAELFATTWSPDNCQITNISPEERGRPALHTTAGEILSCERIEETFLDIARAHLSRAPVYAISLGNHNAMVSPKHIPTGLKAVHTCFMGILALLYTLQWPTNLNEDFF